MSEPRKDIPNVEFQQDKGYTMGMELVSISRIEAFKHLYEPNPEHPHQIQFYNLIYFTSGEGRHFVDFHWYDIHEPTFLYIAKGQVTSFDFSGSLKGYCIIFTEDYFLKNYNQFPEGFTSRMLTPQLHTPTVSVAHHPSFSNYFQLLQTEMSTEFSGIQESVTNALVTVLMAKAEAVKNETLSSSAELKKSQLFLHFYKLVEQQYTTSRSAAAYAEQLAITYKHLNEVCKAVQRKTAKEVIDDFIILMAKRRLVNSEVKSNELGYEMGFEDPTNFTKYFKQRTGLTPKSFKKSISK